MSRTISKITYFTLLALALNTGCDQKSVDTVTAAPKLSSITSRVPDSGGDNHYLEIKGTNFGGNGWSAVLKKGAEEVKLVSENLPATSARLVIPTSANLIQGVYDLLISNAFGQDSGTVTTLKGDTGDQGPKGDKGDTGDPGASGATGTQGPAGADGADGVFNLSDITAGSIGPDKLSLGKYIVVPTLIATENVTFTAPGFRFTGNTSKLHFWFVPPKVATPTDATIKARIAISTIAGQTGCANRTLRTTIQEWPGSIQYQNDTFIGIENGNGASALPTIGEVSSPTLHEFGKYHLTIERTDNTACDYIIDHLALEFSDVVETPSNNSL